MIKCKRIELALVALMAVLFGYAACVALSQQKLADGLLRLHVIANSDRIVDQQVKIMVRDRILEIAEPLLKDVQSQQQVRTVLAEHLQQITDEANAVLQQHSVPYSLSAQIAYEYYPTRVYDTFSLPAGNYTGLKIKLGQAVGKNWWCVVFPPLCTDAAEAPQNALCQGATFRFKTAEMIGQVRAWLKQW